MPTKLLNNQEIETLQTALNRLKTRLKQITLSLNTTQYEVNSINRILNAIQEDLKTGES